MKIVLIAAFCAFLPAVFCVDLFELDPSLRSLASLVDKRNHYLCMGTVISDEQVLAVRNCVKNLTYPVTKYNVRIGTGLTDSGEYRKVLYIFYDNDFRNPNANQLALVTVKGGTMIHYASLHSFLPEPAENYCDTRIIMYDKDNGGYRRDHINYFYENGLFYVALMSPPNNLSENLQLIWGALLFTEEELIGIATGTEPRFCAGVRIHFVIFEPVHSETIFSFPINMMFHL